MSSASLNRNKVDHVAVMVGEKDPNYKINHQRENVKKIREIDKLKTEREVLSATYEEKLKQKTNKENPKQGKGGITRELKAQRAKSFDKAKSIVSARLKGLDYNNVADLQKAIQIYRDAIKELE